MLVYRLSIWSERGRIERDVESARDDALECIHAAGLLATGLREGAARPAATDARGRHPAEAEPQADERSASLVRHARTHLKEAWLLLAHAGAQEAVSHVRQGLRLARPSRTS